MAGRKPGLVKVPSSLATSALLVHNRTDETGGSGIFLASRPNFSTRSYTQDGPGA